MSTDFSFVEPPPQMLPVLGDRDGGSRVYRKQGHQEEVACWTDAIFSAFGPCVSPGGVSMYCPVSRAAVHKRVKEGNLTLFLFHVTHRKTFLFGKKITTRSSPYGFIPVSEIKAWRKELEERAISQGKVTVEELEGAKPDWDGAFLSWQSRWMKDQVRSAKESRK